MSQKELQKKKKNLIEVKQFTKYIIILNYDFRKFKTIRSFGKDIKTNFINMYTENVNKDIWQSILKNFKVRQDHKVILN